MNTKVNYLNLFNSSNIIRVKNAVNTTENGTNQLEKYFKIKYGICIPSSYTCSLCGKKIIRKLSQHNPNWSEKNIMVGGHLKDTLTGDLYLAPICKECNDKKENLEPIFINKNILLSLK